MPRAFLDVAEECFLEFCKGMQPGGLYAVRVCKNPLPEDTKVVGVGPLVSTNQIRLELESKDFTEGETLRSPWLEIVRQWQFTTTKVARRSMSGCPC